MRTFVFSIAQPLSKKKKKKASPSRGYLQLFALTSVFNAAGSVWTVGRGCSCLTTNGKTKGIYREAWPLLVRFTVCRKSFQSSAITTMSRSSDHSHMLRLVDGLNGELKHALKRAANQTFSKRRRPRSIHDVIETADILLLRGYYRPKSILEWDSE